MKRILLVLSLLITSLTYSQEDILDKLDITFTRVGTSIDNQEIYYYKVDNTDFETNTVSVWFKVKFVDKKVKNKKGKLITQKQGHQLSYMVFHCETSTQDELEYYKYDSQGKIIDQGNLYSYDKRIVPSTIGESIFNMLCE